MDKPSFAAMVEHASIVLFGYAELVEYHTSQAVTLRARGQVEESEAHYAKSNRLGREWVASRRAARGQLA